MFPSSSKMIEIKEFYSSKYIKINKSIYCNRKTPIYYIWSNIGGVYIGEIKWFSNWRKYCFFPYENSVWDYKCLNEILENLNKINEKS